MPFKQDAFMQPEITGKEEWYKIDGLEGISYYQKDMFTFEDAIEAYGLASYQRDQCEKVEGYGARMSAPGYLDCTDWCVFDTIEEAEAYLEEMYGEEDDEEEEEEEPFISSCLRQCVLPQDEHTMCQFEDGSLHDNR